MPEHLRALCYNIGTDDLEEGVTWSSWTTEAEYLDRSDSVVASTPTGAGAQCENPPATPIPQLQAQLEILPNVINPPGWERNARESFFIEQCYY